MIFQHSVNLTCGEHISTRTRDPNGKITRMFVQFVFK
nr:MAG TPA: hypothetical protein [Caudoviricetes sp.]